MKIRNTVVLILLFWGYSNVYSQDPLDAIADGTCDCINKKDFTGMDQNAFYMDLGTCMLTAAMPHKKKLKKVHGIELDGASTDVMERLGEMVGGRMVQRCPEFITLISEKMEDGTLEDGEDESEGTININGEIIEVKTEEFLVFEVKEENGDVYSIILLEQVDGLLIGEDSSVFVGKLMNATTKTTEIYSPKKGAFVQYYELLDVDLK